MNDENFRVQIIQNIEHIGTSPTLSLKIMQEVNRSDADLTTITSLLMDDPTICAQVLKVANSTYFATRERIVTVSQAVINLGLENIKQILFAIEIIGVFRADLSTKKFKEELFWRHSIAAGFLALELGHAKQYPIDAETLYITGILRNIGVLAIRQFLPAEFDAIINLMERKRIDFKAASREVIGINHREIGYLIGIKWNLPEDIVNSLGENDLKDSSLEKAMQIRTVMQTVEAMLAAKQYSSWDPFCKYQSKIDLENMDELCLKVFDQVDLLYQKLWC
jgi:HD-like signal output (HDOD) protein